MMSRGKIDQQIHLTFRLQGRIAFSAVTIPKIGKGNWYEFYAVQRPTYGRWLLFLLLLLFFVVVVVLLLSCLVCHSFLRRPLFDVRRYMAVWLFQQDGKNFSDVKSPTTKNVKFYLRFRDISLGAQVAFFGE